MSKLSKLQRENKLLQSTNAMNSKRIASLEAANTESKRQAQEAKIDSELDRVLGDFAFASLDSRALARNHYRLQINRDDDSGELTIGDRSFEAEIRNEIPVKFNNLLAKAKDGSRITKGPSLAELLDNIGPTSTPEQKAEAARRIGALL